ncbi:MAG: hypothetical protein AB7S38_17770 [Vulcanimicrobiota bacterium]
MSELSSHYEFAHRTLPRLVHDQPERFEQMLCSIPPLAEVWKGAPLAVHYLEVDGVGPAIIIKMPPPSAPAEAFMVAVLKTTPWRYITLERTRPEFGEASMLGEWTSTSRSGLGPGPEPSLEAFSAALAELESPAVGFNPLDLQPSLDEVRQVQSGRPVSMSVMRFVSCHALLLQADSPRLGLRWWNFVKRRRARVLFPALCLQLLGHHLLRAYPNRFEEIGLAVSGNALRFGVEATFLPEDEDPTPAATATLTHGLQLAPDLAGRLVLEYSTRFANSVANLGG